MNDSTIYFCSKQKSIYLMSWGIGWLNKIGNDHSTDLLSKDITDFKTIAKSILSKSKCLEEDVVKDRTDFIKLLNKENVTLDELKLTDFITKVCFPIYNGYFESMCRQGHEKIGTGTFGSVEKIKCGNHYFAVKKIEFDLKDIKKAKNEALILKEASEECEYIVRYYEFWIEENKDGRDKYELYIKMEYCDNNTLDSIDYTESGEYLAYIKPLLLGIKSIHEKKIAHRDLKLNNIFIGDTLKIGDFGVSEHHSDGFRVDMKEDLFNLSLIIYKIYTSIYVVFNFTFFNITFIIIIRILEKQWF